MSVGCELKSEHIRSFEKRTGIALNLEAAQREQLEMDRSIVMSTDQLDELLERLCPTSSDMRSLVTSRQDLFEQVSMTLYVLNTDTWKLMQRRENNQSMMLPMVTFPWFHWDQSAMSESNPIGVRRGSEPNTLVTIDSSSASISLVGRGGDFCGFVEGRVANGQSGGRAILIPARSGEKQKVPHYRNELLRVSVKIEGLDIILYPPSDKSLDYNFSESPSVYRRHGLLLKTDGSHVALQVGKGSRTNLRGETTILLGRRFEEPQQDNASLLLFHMWLNAVKRVLETSE